MVEYIIRSHNIKPSLLFHKELLLVIIPLIFHRTSGKKKKIHLPMKELQETQVQSLGQEDPYRINSNPLQYSCLENSMNRGAWWAAVYGVPKSRTRLSRSSRLYFDRGPWFSPGHWGKLSCRLSVSRPFGLLPAFVHKFWLSNQILLVFLWPERAHKAWKLSVLWKSK